MTEQSHGVAAKTAAKKSTAKKPVEHAIKKSASKAVTVTKTTGGTIGKTKDGTATPRKGARGARGYSIVAVTALRDRTGYLVDNLGGGTKLAGLLGVSKSQPTRWRKGEEQPSPAKAREILDLDHVVARASLLWGSPDVVRDWLEGSNQFLDGARPIDVLQVRGVADVLAALEAETQLAFG